MIFTEKIEKLLASNHIQEVIDEFLKFLSEVPQSNTDARSDANQLRGQVIILSGRFNELNSKVNTNTINQDSANIERATVINSFISILDQLPSGYPDLNNYLQEKNEDDEWRNAQKKNSIDGYHEYFDKYPNGKYKAATIKLIAELEEVKQKQDNEIKRLALLEKERREKDKIIVDSDKAQSISAMPVFQPGGDNRQSSHTKKSRPFFFITSGIVLTTFVVLIIVFTGRNKKNIALSDAIAGSEPTEAVKTELKMAYKSGIETYYNAIKSGNKKLLSESFKGEAEKYLSKFVDDAVANNYFIVPRFTNEVFKMFKENENKSEVEVVIVRTSEITYFNRINKTCVNKRPEFQETITLFFIKAVNGWIISSYSYENDLLPQLIPCTDDDYDSTRDMRPTLPGN